MYTSEYRRIFNSVLDKNINSEKLYSCQQKFNQRFNRKLQQCVPKFEDSLLFNNLSLHTRSLLYPSKSVHLTEQKRLFFNHPYSLFNR